MDNQNYTGNKTKNYFTAYLQKSIRWKRWKYLRKKRNIRSREISIEEDSLMKYAMTEDEMLELHYEESLLFKKRKNEYLIWNELSNQKLIDSLLLLREEERMLIYQYVFEEKTFKEISSLKGSSEEKVKNSYYYAIRKIRKWMKNDDGI